MEFRRVVVRTLVLLGALPASSLDKYAEAKAKAGDAKAATLAFNDAAKALKDAFALAKTRENAAKAAPIIERLNSARDKFLAEDILAQLEALIPSDARMPALREKVQSMPGPAKSLALDLGNNVSMKLVLIRPGKFMMGSPESEKEASSDEGPQHEVTISKPFYMGVTEVTQSQYKAVMGKNPSNFNGPTKPVEMVSWDDAVDFCKKLSDKTGKNFRLPTEAEWEYACRAGTRTRFCFGDNEGELASYAWYFVNSGSKTHPVGEKSANSWGLYDMHGNVWEWCADWYGGDYYSASPTEDPQGPASGQFRVLRGGSCYYYPTSPPVFCRSTCRVCLEPGNRFKDGGFRVFRGL